MKRLAIAAVLMGFAALGVAQTSFAQSKPNFAGTWKLNVAKSDLGQMVPSSETYTIAQTADAITITIASTSDFGTQNYTFTAKLDGTETPIPSSAFPADSPFKLLSSKAAWQGGALTITQTTNFQDTKGTLTSTYTISDDGKALTRVTHIVFDQGAFDSKSVYDKA